MLEEQNGKRRCRGREGEREDRRVDGIEGMLWDSCRGSVKGRKGVMRLYKLAGDGVRGREVSGRCAVMAGVRRRGGEIAVKMRGGRRRENTGKGERILAARSSEEETKRRRRQ